MITSSSLAAQLSNQNMETKLSVTIELAVSPKGKRVLDNPDILELLAQTRVGQQGVDILSAIDSDRFDLDLVAIEQQLSTMLQLTDLGYLTINTRSSGTSTNRRRRR